MTGLVLLALGSIGCASKGFVHRQLDTEAAHFEARHAALENNLEHTQSRLEQADDVLTAKNAAQDVRLDNVSRTASEALDRALEAGKLAEGKLLFETVLSDDLVRFAPDRFELSAEAQEALNALGSQLVTEDRNVYLEIQGHTDAIGAEDYNMRLGEERAVAVRRFLNMEHGIPLHRMATISYGEAAPVSDNASRDGRAKNRRVVVVVLR